MMYLILFSIGALFGAAFLACFMAFLIRKLNAFECAVLLLLVLISGSQWLIYSKGLLP